MIRSSALTALKLPQDFGEEDSSGSIGMARSHAPQSELLHNVGPRGKGHCLFSYVREGQPLRLWLSCQMVWRPNLQDGGLPSVAIAT